MKGPYAQPEQACTLTITAVGAAQLNAADFGGNWPFFLRDVEFHHHDLLLKMNLETNIKIILYPKDSFL